MRVIRVHPVRFLSRLLLGVVVSVTLLATGAPARALEASGFTYVVSSRSATVTGCVGTCPTTLAIPATLGGYSVKTIAPSAFRDKQLTSVTIPNSVTSIDKYAFRDNQLSSVTIPNSVTIIDYGVFSFNQLTSVTIPNSVTIIGNHAFRDNQLSSVTIPNSVTIIGPSAFRDNQLTSVTIPNSVAGINDYAFSNNQLTSVTIPNSVLVIGNYAFGANQLTSVTIPNSVVSIANYAFVNNELTSVTFEGNAPDAGRDVFYDNGSLNAIKRYKGTTGWGSTWGGMLVDILPAVRAAATVKPTIRGTATVNKTLTAAKGTWTGHPAPTFTYQWYACTNTVTVARATVPSTCKRITGATRSTFTLTSAQRGKYVTVLVTGTSAGTTRTTWLSKTTTKIK
jgi:hypothetical protein